MATLRATEPMGMALDAYYLDAETVEARQRAERDDRIARVARRREAAVSAPAAPEPIAAAPKAATTRRARAAKPESPFAVAMRLRGDAGLIGHLSANADALGLSAIQRKRLAVVVSAFEQLPLDRAWVRAFEGAALILRQLASRGEIADPTPSAVIAEDEPFTQKQRENLRRAEQLADPDGVYRNPVAAARVVLGVEAQRARIAGERAVADGLSESERLETARGARVTRDGKGVRFHGRDGLAALYDGGALTGLSAEARSRDMIHAPDAWTRASARLFAGLAYRKMVEETNSGLRSQLGQVEGAGNGDIDSFLYYRAKAGQEREEIDRLVRFARGANVRGLQVLRLVAGEGRLIGSIGRGGKQDRLNTDALIAALDVVAVYLRVPGSTLLTAVRK